MSQFGRPISVIASSGVSVTGGTYAWEVVDEETPSDTDYFALSKGDGRYCNMGITSLSTPATRSNHTLRIRVRYGSAAPTDRLRVMLFCGSVCVASRFLNSFSTTITTFTFSLTTSEICRITDYTALSICVTNVNSAILRVYWTELEIPDAGTPAACDVGDGSAQLVPPLSVITEGLLTTVPSGTALSCVDETVASDSDYFYAYYDGVTFPVFSCFFGEPTYYPASTSGFKLRIRAKGADDGDAITAYLRLGRNGDYFYTSPLSSYFTCTLTTSWKTFEFDVDGATPSTMLNWLPCIQLSLAPYGMDSTGTLYVSHVQLEYPGGVASAVPCGLEMGMMF